MVMLRSIGAALVVVVAALVVVAGCSSRRVGAPPPAPSLVRPEDALAPDLDRVGAREPLLDCRRCVVAGAADDVAVIDDDEFEVRGRDDDAAFQPALAHAVFYADMAEAVEQEPDDPRHPGGRDGPDA